MLTSLRSKSKHLRKEDDTDARIARKAHKAERDVTQSAVADLKTWEKARGYLRTSSAASPSLSPAISASFKELPVASADSFASVSETARTEPKRGTVLDNRKANLSKVSSAPRIDVETPGRLDFSLLTLSKVTDTELAFPLITSSTLANPPLSQTKEHVYLPSTSETQGRDKTGLQELEEKEALLKEIQEIRKTIRELRDEVSSPPPPSTLIEATQRPGRNDLLAAPWVTMERSGCAIRARKKSVADIFAPDAPQPPSPYRFATTSTSSAPRLRLPESVTGLASSPVKDTSRRRSRSIGTGTIHIDQDFARDVRPLPHITEHAPRWRRPKTLYDRPTTLPSPIFHQSRKVTITPEEQKQRYQAALGRPPARSDQGRSGRGGEMTLSELQDRHLAKLRQLQSATTLRLAAAETRAFIQEERERRKLRASQEPGRKSDQRQEAVMRVSVSTPTSKKTIPGLSLAGRRSKTMSMFSLGKNVAHLEESERGTAADHHAKGRKSRASLSLLSPREGQRPCMRANLAQRAGDWRPRVISMGKFDGLGVLSSSSFVKQEHTECLTSQAKTSSSKTALSKAPACRSLSTAGLLTIPQGASPSRQSAPIAQEAMTVTRGSSRRDDTATEARRLRERAGRRQSTMPSLSDQREVV